MDTNWREPPNGCVWRCNPPRQWRGIGTSRPEVGHCFGDLQQCSEQHPETVRGTMEDFRRWVHPDDRGRVREVVEHAQRNRQPFTTEFRHRLARRYGTLDESRGSFHYSSTGDPGVHVGYGGGYHRAQSGGGRTTAFGAAVQPVLRNPAGILATSSLPRGRSSTSIAAACEALGYSKEELVGKPLSIVLCPGVAARR